ncbi:hypothetical protein HK405_006695 [Cladochytrium tenue]|nr:hypothetical protein HK405_006695 [Cladochytrium tenue]
MDWEVQLRAVTLAGQLLELSCSDTVTTLEWCPNCRRSASDIFVSVRGGELLVAAADSSIRVVRRAVYDLLAVLAGDAVAAAVGRVPADEGAGNEQPKRRRRFDATTKAAAVTDAEGELGRLLRRLDLEALERGSRVADAFTDALEVDKALIQAAPTLRANHADGSDEGGPEWMGCNPPPAAMADAVRRRRPQQPRSTIPIAIAPLAPVVPPPHSRHYALRHAVPASPQYPGDSAEFDDEDLDSDSAAGSSQALGSSVTETIQRPEAGGAAVKLPFSASEYSSGWSLPPVPVDGVVPHPPQAPLDNEMDDAILDAALDQFDRQSVVSSRKDFVPSVESLKVADEIACTLQERRSAEIHLAVSSTPTDAEQLAAAKSVSKGPRRWAWRAGLTRNAILSTPQPRPREISGLSGPAEPPNRAGLITPDDINGSARTVQKRDVPRVTAGWWEEWVSGRHASASSSNDATQETAPPRSTAAAAASQAKAQLPYRAYSSGTVVVMSAEGPKSSPAAAGEDILNIPQAEAPPTPAKEVLWKRAVAGLRRIGNKRIPFDRFESNGTNSAYEPSPTLESRLLSITTPTAPALTSGGGAPSPVVSEGSVQVLHSSPRECVSCDGTQFLADGTVCGNCNAQGSARSRPKLHSSSSNKRNRSAHQTPKRQDPVLDLSNRAQNSDYNSPPNPSLAMGHRETRFSRMTGRLRTASSVHFAEEKGTSHSGPVPHSPPPHGKRRQGLIGADAPLSHDAPSSNLTTVGSPTWTALGSNGSNDGEPGFPQVQRSRSKRLLHVRSEGGERSFSLPGMLARRSKTRVTFANSTDTAAADNDRSMGINASSLPRSSTPTPSVTLDPGPQSPWMKEALVAAQSPLSYDAIDAADAVDSRAHLAEQYIAMHSAVVRGREAALSSPSLQAAAGRESRLSRNSRNPDTDRPARPGSRGMEKAFGWFRLGHGRSDSAERSSSPSLSVRRVVAADATVSAVDDDSSRQSYLRDVPVFRPDSGISIRQPVTPAPCSSSSFRSSTPEARHSFRGTTAGPAPAAGPSDGSAHSLAESSNPTLSRTAAAATSAHDDNVGGMLGSSGGLLSEKLRALYDDIVGRRESLTMDALVERCVRQRSWIDEGDLVDGVVFEDASVVDAAGVVVYGAADDERGATPGAAGGDDAGDGSGGGGDAGNGGGSGERPSSTIDGDAGATSRSEHNGPGQPAGGDPPPTPPTPPPPNVGTDGEEDASDVYYLFEEGGDKVLILAEELTSEQAAAAAAAGVVPQLSSDALVMGGV